MKQIFAFLFILFFLTSCSGIKTISPSPAPSHEVKLTEEELARQRVLEYYRLMRAKEWDRLQKKSSPKKIVITPKSESTQTPPALKPKIVEEIIPTNEDEQRVEIEQNVVFFCMNRKKFKDFSNEEQCLEFSKNIQEQCEEEFIFGDARLTRCIKSRLKY